MFIFKKAFQKLEARRCSKIILPELRDWQLFFEEKHGEENRIKVMQTFINFIIDQNRTEVTIPGYCIIEGEAYGHDSFNDKERIFTSYVKKIFTIDEKTMTCINQSPEAWNRFLVGIETVNGGKYWLDYLKKNEYMDRLEFDFVINRKLSTKPGCYVPLCYENCGFL